MGEFPFTPSPLLLSHHHRNGIVLADIVTSAAIRQQPIVQVPSIVFAADETPCSRRWLLFQFRSQDENEIELGIQS